MNMYENNRRNQQMKNEGNKRKADQTISALDSVQRAKAPPFFYARLKAKIGGQTGRLKYGAHHVREKFSFAVIGFIFLVLLNIYVVWQSSIRTNDTVREAQMAFFAEEYGMTYTNY
jgi:hypothetical protein